MAFVFMGTGGALPAREVLNDDLAAFLDTSDEWIRERTGITARRICTTETLDDLATSAAQEALDDAGVTADELDLIVVSTATGDHLIPATACVVAQGIGASCPAFDVSAACSGFVFALDVADGWFCRGRARRVLVVAAERMSRAVDWTDRGTCVLFGDGAAAAVLGEGGDGPLWLNLSTQPDVEALEMASVAGTSPFYELESPEPVLHMAGRKVFRFAVNAICDELHTMSQETGIALEDIDHFVFHQANMRIIDSAVGRLGIDPARVARSLATTGNISSACIPLALDRLARSGELTDGQLVVMLGFGAGLDVGTCLIRWGNPQAS